MSPPPASEKKGETHKPFTLQEAYESIELQRSKMLDELEKQKEAMAKAQESVNNLTAKLERVQKAINLFGADEPADFARQQ